MIKTNRFAELFTVFHNYVQKACATLRFFLSPAMFKYDRDSIGET